MLQNISTAILSNDFATSVATVFGSMIGMKANCAEVFEGMPRTLPGNIIALVTVSSSNATGIVTLHCDAPLSLAVYAAMFGETPENCAESDVYDAVGELANVIVGNFKNTLKAAENEVLRMSIPTIVVGRQIPTPAHVKWFAVKFDIQNLPLFGSMLITPNAQ